MDEIKKRFLTDNKKLIDEWNFKRNKNINPEYFTHQSNKTVWWICKKCGHEWKSKINNRSNGRGCPCCSNKVVVKGKNDLATVNPILASEWNVERNFPLTAGEVTIGSGKKVWWLCPKGHEYQASVMHRGHGTNCPICNAGKQTSFPEKALFYYVRKIYPDAISCSKNILGNRMELDIYIPSIRTAIEYDGIYWHKKAVSKEREIKKYNCCREKGIKLLRVKEGKYSFDGFVCDWGIYIEPNWKEDDLDITIKRVLKRIDCSLDKNIWVEHWKIYSKIEVNTKRDKYKILEYLNEKKNSLNSVRPDLIEEWNYEKNHSFLPSMVTTGSTKKAWWKCKMCGYEWEASVSHSVIGTGCPICYKNRKSTYNAKKIFQYSIAGDFIKEWASIIDAARTLKINDSNISMCAKHQRAKAGDFRWEYEYHNRLSSIKKKKINRTNQNGKKVLQLNNKGEVLNEYPSLNRAAQEVNINPSNISKVLHGKIKTAAGFYWKLK